LEHWRSLDSLVAFYILATWRRLLAWRMLDIGGGEFGILKEGFEW